MQKNLIQARFLFEKAQLLWEPYRDITNGLVVSLLQDSAELVLWAIVKAHSVDVKRLEGFVSILDKLSIPGKVLHGKAQILEINTSRVAYKHYGVSPATSDVPRFIDGTGFFLRENVREYLELDFDTVSLADEVEDSKLRSLLKDSEHFRSEGDLEEALVQVSLAFQRVLRLAQDRQFGDFPRLDDAYRLFPSESQDAARDLISNLSNFCERFSDEHAMFTLGVDQALFEELESRRLTVNISESGKRLGVYSHPRTQVSLENVNFLISNVTDISRRVRGAR